MEKLYNKRSQYTCLRAPACAGTADRNTHRQRRGRGKMFRENTNHLQRSFFDIYRETVIGIKEKKDKGIGGIQFLPTNFQEDKRGKLLSE
jgi:hypothetical protein